MRVEVQLIVGLMSALPRAVYLTNSSVLSAGSGSRESVAVVSVAPFCLANHIERICTFATP